MQNESLKIRKQSQTKGQQKASFPRVIECEDFTNTLFSPHKRLQFIRDDVGRSFLIPQLKRKLFNVGMRVKWLDFLAVWFDNEKRGKNGQVNYVTNYTQSQNYTVALFFFQFLLEAFTRVSNFYFLIQAVLSWIQAVSPFANGVGSTAALIFVLAFAAIKQGIEDIKRFQEDQKTNNAKVYTVSQEKGMVQLTWKEVRVGMLILIKNDEFVPADICCVACCSEHNVCFVQTTNLDGETNLKQRGPPQSSSQDQHNRLNQTLKSLEPQKESEEKMKTSDTEIIRISKQVYNSGMIFQCEAPNNNMHSFSGRVTLKKAIEIKVDDPEENEDAHPMSESNGSAAYLNIDNMLLRGTQMKNTPWVLGVVIYTGDDTRIQKNANKTPFKVGSFDLFLNRQILILIFLQVVLCICCAGVGYYWKTRFGVNNYYFRFDINNINGGNPASPVGYVLLNFLTFWVLFSYLVPIALFVSVVIVKFVQGIIINNDRFMLNPRANNTNLNEDLGRVGYIFSDKTGTLTSNEMQLRGMAIKQEIYGDHKNFKIENYQNLPEHPADLLKLFDRNLYNQVIKYIPSNSRNQQINATHSGNNNYDQAQNRAGGSNMDGENGDIWQQIVEQGGAKDECVLSLFGSYRNIGDEEAGTSALLDSISQRTRSDLNASPLDNYHTNHNDKQQNEYTQQNPNISSHQLSMGSKRWGKSFIPSFTGSRRDVQRPIEHQLSFYERSESRKRGFKKHHSQRDLVACQDNTILVQHLVEFWTNICICNSLLVERKPEEENSFDQVQYQGTSPDEVSLVSGGRQLGFEFTQRSLNKMKLKFMGFECEHEVLFVNDFSSKRQRMSVVARTPTGRIKVYVKGADTIMLTLLREHRGSAFQRMKDSVNHILNDFAIEGLRTLVLGSKFISDRYYEDWNNKYSEAQSTNDEEAMDDIVQEIEHDIELVGITAIEDKLQGEVDETIDAFLRAGLKFWMITGDKQQTAENIAQSCALFTSNILSTTKEGFGPKGEKYYRFRVINKGIDNEKEAKNSVKKQLQDANKMLEEITRNNTDDSEDVKRRLEFVIDGPALTYVIKDTQMEHLLAETCIQCGAVVVCRAAPKQKSDIVRIVQEYENNVLPARKTQNYIWPFKQIQRFRLKSKKMIEQRMLAIGDGANDVSMIQQAEVGVGIAGKEGRQAANNADYVIGRFKDLKRLLLVHGALSDFRISRLIKYSFFKNVCYASVLFFFQFYNGFSGSTLIDEFTGTLYNVVFTSVPILFASILDFETKEVSEYENRIEKYNKVHHLRSVLFWKAVIWAILTGALCFFVPYYTQVITDRNSVHDLYSIGHTVYMALLGSVQIEVMITARNWSLLFSIFTVLSYVIALAYFGIIGQIRLRLNSADLGVNGAYMILGSYYFWNNIIVVYIIFLTIRLMDFTFTQAILPADRQKTLQKYQQQQDEPKQFEDEEFSQSKY